MTHFVYDGSFPGLLTTVFEVFERKSERPVISRFQQSAALLFADNITVTTDLAKAKRVLEGLKKKFSPASLKNIYWSYLSELNGIENTILVLIRYAYAAGVNIETNFGHPAVLEVAQVARKVGREKHRFEAFIRFELIDTNFFYAPVDPDFNVLPIILPHFKRRYAAQDWIIYDTKRKYGIHYDQTTESVQEAVIDFSKVASDLPAAHSFDPEDDRYKDLWRNYFKSVNIPSRKNTQLHLQHVPRRYWKYLVEKNIFL